MKLPVLPSRSLYTHIVICIGFAILSVLLMWPINPIHSWNTQIQFGDASILAYLISWGSNALFTNPIQYYQVPLAFPRTHVLAGMDGMIFQALLAAPVWHSSHNPVLTYNFALWLSFCFCLTSGYVAAYCLLKSHILAVVVAIIFTVTSDRYFHTNGHINLLYTGFIPLVFTFTYLAIFKSNRKFATISGICFGLSVYASNYTFILCVLTFACAILCALTQLRFSINKGVVYKMAAILTLAVIISWPIPLIHWSASRNIQNDRSSLSTAMKYEATIPGWTRPPSYPDTVFSRDAKIMGLVPTENTRGEDCQFLGFLVGFCVTLELLRLIATRASNYDAKDLLSALVLIAAIFLILASFGPYISIFGYRIPGPYMLLHKGFLQFTGFFRVPSRLAFITQWLLALVIGISLSKFLINSPLRRNMAALAVIGITLFEHVSITSAKRYEFKEYDIIKTLNRLDPSGDEPAVIIPDPQSLGVIGLSTISNWRPLVNAWPDNPLLTEYNSFFKSMNDINTSQSITLLKERRVKWVITLTKEASDQADKSEFLVQKYRIPHQGLYELISESQMVEP